MPRPYNLLIDKNKKRFFTKRRGIDSLSLDGNRGSKFKRFSAGTGGYFLDPRVLTVCFFSINVFHANEESDFAWTIYKISLLYTRYQLRLFELGDNLVRYLIIDAVLSFFLSFLQFSYPSMPDIWMSKMIISELKVSTFPKAYSSDSTMSTVPKPAKSAAISWLIIFSSSTTSNFCRGSSSVTEHLLKLQ